MADDLRQRIAALRAQGKTDREIARLLQDERNAAKRETPPKSLQNNAAAPAQAVSEPQSITDKVKGALSSLIDVDRKVLNGLAFGFGPEVEGAVRTALTGSDFRKVSEQARAGNERFGNEHPYVSAAAELGGGLVLPFGGLARGAKTASTLGREAGAFTRALDAIVPRASVGKLSGVKNAGKGALIGGSMGALSGAGHGGPDNRIGGGVLGGLSGSVLGGLIPAAYAAGPRVSGAVIGGGIGATQDPEDPLIGALLGAGGGAVAGAGVGRLAEAAVPSVRRVLQSASRAVNNKRGSVKMRGGKDETALLMERILGGSGRSEQRGAKILASRATIPEAFDAAGKPVVGADALGEEAQKLFGSSMNIGNDAVSDARTFLTGRGQNRPARMAEDVTKATKTTPVNLTSRAREIAQDEAPAVSSAYERANRESPRVKLSPEAKAALSTPAGKRAYQSALARAADNLDGEPLGGITYGDLMKTPTRETLDLIADRLTDFQAAGGKDFLSQVVDEVDVRTLDAVKQRLDVMIGQAKKAGDKTKMRDLVKVKEAFVSDAEGQAPLYTQAKGLAQETKQRGKAVETGAKLGKLKNTPDEIMAATDNLSPLEEEEVRNAAAQVMRQDRVANPATRHRALNPEQDLAQDQQMQALFGGQEARELARLDQLERTMRATERAPGGSQTAGRLADFAEIGDDITAQDARNPKAALTRKLVEATVLPVWRRAMVGGPKVAASVVRGSMAGSQNPADLQDLFTLLRALQAKQGTRNALAQRLSGLAGQSVGRLGGS